MEDHSETVENESSSRVLAIVPDQAAVAALGVTRFSVEGAAPGEVTWSVSPPDIGVFQDGVFMGPAEVTEPRIVSVTATAADGRSAFAVVRLVSFQVGIVPPAVELRPGQTQQFSAFVKGDPSNSVTWTVTPGVGTLANGLYTAPKGSFENDAVEITATSTADPSRSTTARVSLLRPPPMPALGRRTIGAALILLCLALCGGVIAIWPISFEGVVQDSATAAEVYNQKRAAAEKARADLEGAQEAAKTAAEAKGQPLDEKVLADAVKTQQDALTMAEAEERAAGREAQDRAEAAKAVRDLVAVRLGTTTMSREVNLLLLALVLGALGSFLHAARSFTGFVGNRTLVASWAWWYALQPFMGMTLALVFYLVVRGGLFSTGSDSSAVSPFGIAAVSGLVGMFSKQATDKLAELFCILFKTSEDNQRKDKLGGAAAAEAGGSAAAASAGGSE